MTVRGPSFLVLGRRFRPNMRRVVGELRPAVRSAKTGYAGKPTVARDIESTLKATNPHPKASLKRAALCSTIT